MRAALVAARIFFVMTDCPLQRRAWHGEVSVRNTLPSLRSNSHLP